MITPVTHGLGSPADRRTGFAAHPGRLIKVNSSPRAGIRIRLRRLFGACRQDAARCRPAPGTGPGVPAIPPGVVAPVPAVRHHLAGMQPDPAQPAGDDTARRAPLPFPGGRRATPAMTSPPVDQPRPASPPAAQAQGPVRPAAGSITADGRITRMRVQRPSV